MNATTVRAGAIAVALLLGAFEAERTKAMANQNQTIAARVKEAFEAARRGDLSASSALQELGEAGVPYFTRYLGDPSEDVRRQVVALLKVAGGRAAMNGLIRALGDPVMEIQERAAAALYERYDPQEVARSRRAGTALRRTVREGNTAPQAALLLAYFPGRATEEALGSLRARDPEARTKLRPWMPPIPVALAVSVARSRIAAAGAREELLAEADKAGVPETLFLLSVLPEVDAPEVLHVLARALDDPRETGQGVPSGAEPGQRLCDIAVSAFVRRLKLPVDFELSEARRYSAAEIEQVKRKIHSTLPR